MVVDTIKSFGKSGKLTKELLEQVGITLNKNAIPDDPLPPFETSGVRLGTPPATSRGLTERHMAQIADWIVDACREGADLAAIREQVRQLCVAHPTPSGGVQG